MNGIASDVKVSRLQRRLRTNAKWPRCAGLVMLPALILPVPGCLAGWFGSWIIPETGFFSYGNEPLDAPANASRNGRVAPVLRAFSSP